MRIQIRAIKNTIHDFKNEGRIRPDELIGDFFIGEEETMCEFTEQLTSEESEKISSVLEAAVNRAEARFLATLKKEIEK